MGLHFVESCGRLCTALGPHVRRDRQCNRPLVRVEIADCSAIVDVQTYPPVRIGKDNLSVLAENRLRMTRFVRASRRFTMPRADSTPPNHVNQHNDTLPLTNLRQPPCAEDGRHASTAEDRMLNT